MITKRLFYHQHLNFAWMQTNEARQFLFVGVCGCPMSLQGKGGITINTVPQGQCQFCHQSIEMTPLYAYDGDKHQWRELYKTEEDQFATRLLAFTSRTENSGFADTSAIHPS